LFDFVCFMGDYILMGFGGDQSRKALWPGLNVSKIALEISQMQKYVIEYHIHTYAMLRFAYIFVDKEGKGYVHM
jgi:hypothetical protein